jgi:hypothetical protein
MPNLVPHDPGRGSEVSPPDADWRPAADQQPPTSQAPGRKWADLPPIVRSFISPLVVMLPLYVGLRVFAPHEFGGGWDDAVVFIVAGCVAGVIYDHFHK